jgi:hypothetical protein
MTPWTSSELSTIEGADELELASSRRDGTHRSPVTIWVVRVGDDLYVRSVNGRRARWFRGAQDRHEAHVRAGGVDRDVLLEETDDMADEIDSAYQAKYRRYPARYVDSIVTSKARRAAFRLRPRT